MKVDANMELDVSELYRYTSYTDIHHVPIYIMYLKFVQIDVIRVLDCR